MCEILKLWKEEEYEKVLWYDTTRKNAPALVHNSHGIYISGKNGAVDIVKLRALKIGIVVTLCSQQETETHRHLKIVLEGAGITHRVFKAEDDIGFDITSVAQDVAAWINDTVALPNDRALIHCMGGVNRSSAVAITYLAMFKGLPLCEVIWQAMHNCGRILSNAHFFIAGYVFASSGRQSLYSCVINNRSTHDLQQSVQEEEERRPCGASFACCISSADVVDGLTIGDHIRNIHTLYNESRLPELDNVFAKYSSKQSQVA